MPEKYNAAIIGLGYIGGADQVSGDALGQKVEDLYGTHFHALFHWQSLKVPQGDNDQTSQYPYPKPEQTVPGLRCSG